MRFPLVNPENTYFRRPEPDLSVVCPGLTGVTMVTTGESYGTTNCRPVEMLRV